jgi:cobalt/nickel transport system permease protein
MPLLGKILLAFVPTQLPLGILEGAMTAGMVVLLFRKRPDLLIKMGVIKAGKMVAGKEGAIALIVCFFIACSVLSAPIPADASSWKGVDEAVVEKVAKEHGRGAKALFFDLEEQGDLPLFLFLIAGVVGGFGAGYAWRMLVAEKKPASQTEAAKEGLSGMDAATEKRR